MHVLCAEHVPYISLRLGGICIAILRLHSTAQFNMDKCWHTRYLTSFHLVGVSYFYVVSCLLQLLTNDGLLRNRSPAHVFIPCGWRGNKCLRLCFTNLGPIIYDYTVHLLSILRSSINTGRTTQCDSPLITSNRKTIAFKLAFWIDDSLSIVKGGRWHWSCSGLFR